MEIDLFSGMPIFLRFLYFQMKITICDNNKQENMVTTYLLFFLYCLSIIRKLTLDECSFIYSHFLLLKVFLQCGLHSGLKCK